MRIIAQDSIQPVALKRAVNGDSMQRDEPYIVYDFVAWQEVESQPTNVKAHKACDILNGHELSNGRSRRYAWDFCPERDANGRDMT